MAAFKMALKVGPGITAIHGKLTHYQTLNSKNAAALDEDLMSVGAFSLDQLMELAGLSVSQAGNPKSIHPWDWTDSL